MEVGKFVAMARQGRKSKEWFLGAVTDKIPRDLSLPLSFLEKGKKYLAASGGVAVRFIPMN